MRPSASKLKEQHSWIASRDADCEARSFAHSIVAALAPTGSAPCERLTVMPFRMFLSQGHAEPGALLGFSGRGHTPSPHRALARPPAASAAQQATQTSSAAFAQRRALLSRQSADWEQQQQSPPMLDLSEAGFAQDFDSAGLGPELGLPLWNPDDWHFGPLLGTGSFGAVHEARNAVTGRVVAVKALAKSLAAGRRLPSRGTGRCALFCDATPLSHLEQSAMTQRVHAAMSAARQCLSDVLTHASS